MLKRAMPVRCRVIGWLRLFALSLAAIQAASCSVSPSLAQEAGLVKREILALYDSAQESDVDLTRIHRFAEMPLNHLGFILRFHDIRGKLPEAAEVERYRGVLTWFVGPVSDSNSYLAWAGQVSRMDVRYVILGDVGVAMSPGNVLPVNRLLSLAGVRHAGDFIAPTLGTRVVQKDQSLVEFECRLDPSLPDYPVVDIAEEGTKVGLMLETPIYDGKRQTALVAIGEHGGYAALNYELCFQGPPLYKWKWLLNPFSFFRAAFGAEDVPSPDTTTLSGRRIYFSQVDSDGWNRPSKIERFRGSGAIAAEAVRQELIERFQDLPVTIDLQKNKGERFGRGAQHASTLERVLASPNVDLTQRSLRTTFSRFDSEYPSISNLSPLTRRGVDRDVDAALSDETAYVRVGAVGENGFSSLKETVTRTESPRRLKPFSINYHAYAGEHAGVLQSVKEQLLKARTAALVPISANRYGAIVDGFFAAQIDQIGQATWRIRERGFLQTIRFDAAEGRAVDIQSSVGVIGQSRKGAALYVALDETIEPAVIVLSSDLRSELRRNRLTLVESRWLVRNVAYDDCALSFEAQGYGEGVFTWLGAPLKRHTIIVARAGEEIWRQTAQADDMGQLMFVLPVRATEMVTVRISCGEGGAS